MAKKGEKFPSNDISLIFLPTTANIISHGSQEGSYATPWSWLEVFQEVKTHVGSSLLAGKAMGPLSKHWNKVSGVTPKKEKVGNLYFHHKHESTYLYGIKKQLGPFTTSTFSVCEVGIDPEWESQRRFGNEIHQFRMQRVGNEVSR